MSCGGLKIAPPDDTRIYHDLFIAGDDAYEMLEMLTKDRPGLFRDMDFAKYFPMEAEAFGLFWAAKFGYRDQRRELTFGHLVHVVEQGRWTDPPNPGAGP